MSRETIEVTNKKNLRIARENVGYTTRDATDKVCGKKTKADRVKEWEETASNPTWKQLKKMAKTYDINTFLLTSDEDLTPHREIRDFRKSNGGVNGANLKKFLHFLLERQNFLEYMMEEDADQKNKLVAGGLQHRKNPRKLAEFISEKIGYRAEDLTSQRYPVKYFVNLIEQQDIFVMKTLASNPIEVEEMRGVYIANAYAPIIAINRGDTKTAQMFTLAHELAHLFIDAEGVTNIDFRTISESDPVEQFCNTVASHLLLPERVLEDRKYSLRDTADLAKKYKVSELFTLYRLKDARRIRRSDEKEFEKVIIQRMNRNLQKKRERKGGGSHTNNMKDTNGELFNSFISSLYLGGRLNAVEASKMLQIFVEKVI